MMNIELNKIYNMDCLEGMRKLKDKSVDLVVIDPPYFTTGIKEVGDCAFKNIEEYNHFIFEVVKEFERILKANGSLYIFHNNINVMVDILYYIKKNTKFSLKNQITWDKLQTGTGEFIYPLFRGSDKKKEIFHSINRILLLFHTPRRYWFRCGDVKP